MTDGKFVAAEIASQPECWARAVEVAAANSAVTPQPGERVAVVGCGTSWFMAQSYAALREHGGQGLTDAFTATEFLKDRDYDKVITISRSGTTTEILELLEAQRGVTPTLAIIADPDTPVPGIADVTIVLDFADEQSVVQTRFATTTLALLRASLGENLEAAIADAQVAVDAELPAGILDRIQFTYLGAGWTNGLANEAALKMREAAIAWTESYPAMEYRHGPKSISDERGVVWFLCPPPPGLVEEVLGFGALVVTSDLDPMADLIRGQRLAVALSHQRGLDPDNPRHLTRSVILDD